MEKNAENLLGLTFLNGIDMNLQQFRNNVFIV